MYIEQLKQLAQNKLTNLQNLANLAFQEGRADDYDRITQEIREVEEIIRKLNS